MVLSAGGLSTGGSKKLAAQPIGWNQDILRDISQIEQRAIATLAGRHEDNPARFSRFI